MQRMYALFERDKITGKFKRISPTAYNIQTARTVFQDKLLGGVLRGEPERCLKPVKQRWVTA